MKFHNVPIISYVFEAGADDRVFDSLLLIGPLIIGLVIVLDRSLVTESLAAAYIAVFVLYTLYRAIRE